MALRSIFKFIQRHCQCHAKHWHSHAVQEAREHNVVFPCRSERSIGLHVRKEGRAWSNEEWVIRGSCFHGEGPINASARDLAAGKFSAAAEYILGQVGQASERVEVMWLHEVISKWRLCMGRGGSLVDSTPFVRRVVDSNPAVAPIYGPWASPSLAVACALRRETPTQYPCCVGSASEQ